MFLLFLGGKYCTVMALSTCPYYTIWKKLALLKGRLVKVASLNLVFFLFQILKRLLNGVLSCYLFQFLSHQFL